VKTIRRELRKIELRMRYNFVLMKIMEYHFHEMMESRVGLKQENIYIPVIKKIENLTTSM